jgi:hypothetical protein
VRLASSSAVGLPPPNPSLGGRCQNALGRGFWILVSHGPEMADAAMDGERPPQPPAEDAEHADDVPGAEAPFDFAAMRPARALAKVAWHEMFAQPPNRAARGHCHRQRRQRFCSRAAEGCGSGQDIGRAHLLRGGKAGDGGRKGEWQAATSDCGGVQSREGVPGAERGERQDSDPCDCCQTTAVWSRRAG